MPQENLKRCPFCGGAPVKGYNSGAVTHIYCMDCRATTHYQCREQDAVDSWNTRAPQPQSGDRAKALVDIEQMIEDGAHTSTEIMDKVAALIQPEFEVVDVQDIIGEMIDHSLSHRDVDAGSNQSTVSAVHNCTEWLAMQGYHIVRKKEVP